MDCRNYFWMLFWTTTGQNILFRIFKNQSIDHTGILGKCVWKIPMLKDRVYKKKSGIYQWLSFLYSIIQALRICLTVSFLFWGHHFSLCWKRTSLVIFIWGHSVRIYSSPAMQRSISLRDSQHPSLLWTTFPTYRTYIFYLSRKIFRNTGVERENKLSLEGVRNGLLVSTSFQDPKTGRLSDWSELHLP